MHGHIKSPAAFSLVEPKRNVVPAKAGIHLLQGFSLVELSIVLVILGLLTGGILAGQSLIRAAQLRAVATEYSRYFTAAQSFRDKYFAIPGDMTNATAFWGYQGTTNAPGCATTISPAPTATTTGTCDGNGDGIVNVVMVANNTGENIQFWRQLALAGLIEGSYSGVGGAGGGGGIQCAVPTACPPSKLSGAGWGAYYLGNFGGNANTYTASYGSLFMFGAPNPSYVPINPILKPEEAWNIDTKLDDGKPGTGKVIVTYWAVCTTSTSQTDYTGSYNLSSGTIGCALNFPQSLGL